MGIPYPGGLSNIVLPERSARSNVGEQCVVGLGLKNAIIRLQGGLFLKSRISLAATRSSLLPRPPLLRPSGEDNKGGSLARQRSSVQVILIL